MDIPRRNMATALLSDKASCELKTIRTPDAPMRDLSRMPIHKIMLLRFAEQALPPHPW
jgi:hypothetical protein